MRRAAGVLAAVVIGGVVLKGLVAAIEPRMVFFPDAGEERTPATLGIRYQPVRIDTADGERLMAWQLEPGDPIADVVYFHGNGGNLSLWLPVLATLHEMRLRVLAVDYRGYGLSSGTPSEEGLYRDAEAAVRHAAADRAATRRPLVYWGRSLGGPVAAFAAGVVAPDGVILESTFPDKASVIGGQLILRLLNVFATYRFPTAELLRGVRQPVLVLHGTADTIVPARLGRTLFEQIQGPKTWVEVPGAGHNDHFPAARAGYWTPILDFVHGLAG